MIRYTILCDRPAEGTLSDLAAALTHVASDRTGSPVGITWTRDYERGTEPIPATGKLYTVVRLEDVDIEGGTIGGVAGAEGLFTTAEAAAQHGADHWQARGEYEVAEILLEHDPLAQIDRALERLDDALKTLPNGAVGRGGRGGQAARNVQAARVHLRSALHHAGRRQA